MSTPHHPDPPLERSLPPGQYWRPEPLVMHYGRVPKPRPDRWTFTIGGATASGAEQTFDMDAIRGLEFVEELADMHCATRWSALDLRWSGYRAAELLELAPPDPRVREVLVFAEYGYAANLSLDDLVSPRSLLATHLDGEELTAERGAPLRLVVPHLYTWKGPKWVRGWNYLLPDDGDLGFWEERGYHAHGDAWRQERYAYQSEDASDEVTPPSGR
ncbi:molybdopterin-dependent oxidoreductase [Occultella gossypii]|uniref:Molybdopterin-dependent oxidoreductase n=1 Tax=Occultella gossypii TaxID=2800820 RepID=A0ABS7S5K6_9MICO|nr:molybdopterin-dependent oxidoreductase [Occultella gossypii]MBZ2195629.1 molybdopterin-dependent oxidoreductase [Occultella gossypii]